MKSIEITLIEKALEAAEGAYAPYSEYHVGAALLTDTGEIYTGCNIENASFGATNCAERTAFFKAVSEGHLHFEAIAIVGNSVNQRAKVESDFAYPCGICRQVMQEFCRSNFQIIIAKSTQEYKKYTLWELLPYGFGGREEK